ncbi:hypothetical protein [Streptococcus sp. S784/96/1]|uniref:hypothetical protein n=1 Tax=Streptococcus sp. S784/96/1 TaxID=2653499 RepID=UPI001389ACE8|nr:hypothetical protein [Streptococcus sp. S784/96/1]
MNPVKTLELAEFYQDLHDLLKEVVSDKSLYNTKNWAPRLTLVNRIWEELFSEIFQYCLETFKSISGKITAIKLIRIEKITRLKPCLTIILSIKTAAKKVGCF